MVRQFFISCIVILGLMVPIASGAPVYGPDGSRTSYSTRGLDESTTAELPNCGTDNKNDLRRVTDGIRGIWICDGTSWRSLTGHADIRDFGAVIDGITDDTASRDLWLTALGSGNFETTITGPRVGYLPAGVYKFSTTMVVPAHTKIYGVPFNTVIRPTSAVTTAITLATGATLSEIVVDGINTSSATGVSLGESGPVNNITLRDVVVARFAGTSGRGMFFAESALTHVENVYVTDNQDGAVLYKTATVNPTTTTFVNCIFKSNDRYGFYQLTGLKTRCIGCTVELNGSEGIKIDNNGGTESIEDTTFTDLYIEGNQQSLASGAARHAAYQIISNGKRFRLRDSYVLSSVNEARGMTLDTATDFLVDHTSFVNESGQVLVGGSRGIFANWITGNGLIGSTVTISSGASDILILDNQAFNVKRYRATSGTTLVAGDISLSAGWGSTATVSAISGTDQRFRLTVTSAGTGQSSNPTATLTFKDGTWTTAPFATCAHNGGSQITVPGTWTTTTTALTLTFQGLPVAAETYTFECLVMG